MFVMSLQSYVESSNHQMWTKLNGHTYEPAYVVSHRVGTTQSSWISLPSEVCCSVLLLLFLFARAFFLLLVSILFDGHCWCFMRHRIDSTTLPSMWKSELTRHTLCPICCISYELYTYFIWLCVTVYSLEQPSVMRQRHKYSGYCYSPISRSLQSMAIVSSYNAHMRCDGRQVGKNFVRGFLFNENVMLMARRRENGRNSGNDDNRPDYKSLYNVTAHQKLIETSKLCSLSTFFRRSGIQAVWSVNCVKLIFFYDQK